MRNDLTPAFLVEMSKDHRTPLQYLVFHFSFGDVYISDRTMTIGTHECRGLVEDWGQIGTSGFGIKDEISETLDLTVSIWNGKTSDSDTIFSEYFIADDPINVEVSLYQTFEGLAEEDSAIIGIFVIQDPFEMAESSRLISLELVSLNMKYVSNVGNLLVKSDWPKALESDLNKGIDLIVGDAGEVMCLAAKVPLSATMSGSILKLPTIVNVHDSLDDLGFEQSGYITIDQETMFYDYRDDDTFHVTLRGQKGTIVSEHSDGASVLEYIEDHTYIIGQGPITSVSEVKAGGLLVTDPSLYTIDVDSNPATITFARQPTFVSYARGARSAYVDFDSVASDNGAFQPHYSYDTDFRTSGALVSPSFTPLSILQLDSALDSGEVVRAFLSVEHWATNLHESDYVEVWVDGIGVVGKLSKPNPSDITSLSADVDIDHDHDHAVGGIHDHSYTDPNYGIDDSGHLHYLTAGRDVIVQGYPYNDYVGFNDNLPDTQTFVSYFNFDQVDIPAAVWSATAQIEFVLTDIEGADWADEIVVDIRRYYNGAWSTIASITDTNPGKAKTYTLVIPPWDRGTSLYGYDLAIRVTTTLSNGGFGAVYADISNPLIFCSEKVKETDSNTTSIDTVLAASGSVATGYVDSTGTLIKDISDVDGLVTDNRVLENVVTQSSSRSVTERFDLTKYLESISWDFFLNRKVQLRYVGSTDNVNVIITYISFEVEYRQRQTLNTNEVSCKPVGSIANRPDLVIQYLLNTIAGVPAEYFGSIWANPQTWDDTLIWDDMDTWRDGGEKAIVEGALFDDAAGRYQYLGYRIDGVIPANWTVKDAVATVARQSRGRLVWSAGKVKLAVKEKLDNWIPIREIGKRGTRKGSVSISKGKVSDIYNFIDLFYKVNRLSTAQAEGIYDASVQVLDQNSINKHGQKKDNSNWMFDLVRDDAMAADLADYYLWRYSEPPTYYTWQSYLPQFGVEKGDIIRLTSDFQKLLDKPMRILNTVRIFGSGKKSSINILQFVAESIKQAGLYLIVTDEVLATDDLILGVPQAQIISDQAIISEIIDIVQSDEPNEVLNLGDVAVLTMVYVPKFTETVLVQEEVAVNFSIPITDGINAYDSILTQDALCFGSCPFGGGIACELPFGSKRIYESATSDESTVSDTVALAVSYHIIEDEVLTVTDVLFTSESFSDATTVTEELIFNSCFGCAIPNSTGFGLSNFGR